MQLTLEQAVGQQFLLSFTGTTAPDPALLDAMRRQHVGGIVLFRAKNMGGLDELRELNRKLQQAAVRTGQPPLLIATDQEGGQLMAIGGGTPFPGNLALGATRSEDLAFKVGHALGLEVAAVGINVDFAPVCDVNNNPVNPVVGTRSFGEDPHTVSRLSAAFINGMQTAGVAATAKHFPGHGDTDSDSHHGAPVLPHDEARVFDIELVPFQAAIAAGVKLMMSAHIVFPALNGGTDEPATLSREILQGLLRQKLGFDGIIVTDAMDMKAMKQGAGLVDDTISAVAAGVDLLLFNHELDQLQPAFDAVLAAARRGALSAKAIAESGRRITTLKSWLQQSRQPPLSVVGCDDHLNLAREVARRSITLVRDTEQRIPLRLRSDQRLAVVVPRPEDLTPADTSSYDMPTLSAAVRRYHENVDEYIVDMKPGAAEVGELSTRLADYDLVILGTINATDCSGQAVLANALVESATPHITVAMRLPYDLAVYPASKCYLCTYSILPPAMEALADVLWGRSEPTGRLPLTIPEPELS